MVLYRFPTIVVAKFGSFPNTILPCCTNMIIPFLFTDSPIRFCLVYTIIILPSFSNTIFPDVPQHDFTIIHQSFPNTILPDVPQHDFTIMYQSFPNTFLLAFFQRDFTFLQHSFADPILPILHQHLFTTLCHDSILLLLLRTFLPGLDVPRGLKVLILHLL